MNRANSVTTLDGFPPFGRLLRVVGEVILATNQCDRVGWFFTFWATFQAKFWDNLGILLFCQN